MTKTTILFLFLIKSLLPLASYAEPITGKGELGFSSFTGNSTSKNLSASLNLEQHMGQMKHDLDLEVVRNSSNGQLEAESYVAAFEADYFYKQQTYSFAALRYEEDRFNSFEYQSTLSLGFGSRFIENDREDLDLSIGLGVKKSKENSQKHSSKETIIRFTTEYLYQLSDSAQITESLLIEFGEDNTKTNSTTSLNIYISEEIAVKLSLSIKNNSTTIIGTEKTDTQTTMSLIYSF